MKSLPFHIPEALEKYPFQAEPSRIGYHREYQPGSSLISAYQFASSQRNPTVGHEDQTGASQVAHARNIGIVA